MEKLSLISCVLRKQYTLVQVIPSHPNGTQQHFLDNCYKLHYYFYEWIKRDRKGTRTRAEKQTNP